MINPLLLFISLMQLSQSTPFKVLHCSFVFFRRRFVLNVPKFLRFPVFGFFFREYNR